MTSEQEQSWLERKRKIAKASYEKHRTERIAKVAVNKAMKRIAKSGLQVSNRAKPPKRCTGHVYDKKTNDWRCKEWVNPDYFTNHDRLCKSCNRNKIRNEKRRNHLYRRFYKFVAREKEFGPLVKMRVRKIYYSFFYLPDHSVTGIEKDEDGDEWLVGFFRTGTSHRYQMPCFRANSWFCRKFETQLDEYRKERIGKMQSTPFEIKRAQISLKNKINSRRRKIKRPKQPRFKSNSHSIRFFQMLGAVGQISEAIKQKQTA